jgi:hypothetical protein
MRVLLTFLAVCFAVGLAGCGEPQKSARGFHLPDGDPVRGKAAFVELKCNSCHAVSGVELEAPIAEDVEVQLGGPTPYVRTDGSLVTAIVDPSHALAATYRPQRVASRHVSPMGDFSEAMSVRELIDIVAFLQQQYEVYPPDLSGR